MPALGALAAEPLYLLVDTAIVGHLGRSQLAALGIAFTVLGGIFAIFNSLQYGTTAQVARAGGAGETETARRLGAQAVWLSVAFGVAVSLASRPLSGSAVGAGRRGPADSASASGSSTSAGRVPVDRKCMRISLRQQAQSQVSSEASPR